MDDWTTIRTYVSVAEAVVARASLEAAGFAVRLLDEHRVSLNTLEVLALGGVRLQVPPAAADDALALLDTPVELTEADWKTEDGSEKGKGKS